MISKEESLRESYAVASSQQEGPDRERVAQFSPKPLLAKYRKIHGWSISLKEAASLQNQLRSNLQNYFPYKSIDQIRYLAGADISYNRFSSIAYGAFVILDFKTGQVIEEATACAEMLFPYVPGFLSFREIPVLLAAWKKVQNPPDLVFVDGHGIAHPRRMGIAAHLGLFIEKPTIGCGKTLLFGKYSEPAKEKGSFSYIKDHDEIIGAAVRTKIRVSPMFISPGHMMDLENAILLTNTFVKSYRLPEPTRLAHLLANKARVLGNTR